MRHHRMWRLIRIQTSFLSSRVQSSMMAVWKQLPKKRHLQHSGLLALHSGGHYRSVKRHLQHSGLLALHSGGHYRSVKNFFERVGTQSKFDEGISLFVVYITDLNVDLYQPLQWFESDTQVD
ncbi:hypothetical protein DPMN_070676 [Dreissena polymorpha]|uniref:Uncharacterized protein n=2 Tax=Dreissena polymorpha TaxID=45954 RepID=A0A9D3Z5W4_DREPO|nr:hypothetical protein DPMN_070676 [Dreissena polymorpha]